MGDLRQLLSHAAGDPPDLPDISAIRERARPRIVRRRAAVIVALSAVGFASLAGWSVWDGDGARDRGKVVQPAPAPTPPVSTARDLRLGQLEPGAYRGHVGGYSFVLTTSNDDWKVLVDRPQWVAFTFRQYVLHLQVWESVVSPGSTDASRQREVPADVARWLVENPRLSTGPATRVDVGGVEATQLDVRVVRQLEDPPGECSGQECVVLGRVADAGELIDIEVGQTVRFLVVGRPGHQLVAYYRAPEGEFPALRQAASQFLGGLRLSVSP